jgi:2-dehydropantoate 2-reductase
MVLTAMNGVPWWFLQGFGGALAGQRLTSVDPTGDIAAAIPAQHIIGGVVHASCSMDAPGLVRHHFGNKLIIGEPSGQKTARIEQLGALLEKAGFEAPASSQIQTDIWFKLWGNMTINPISALTGATTDLILQDDLVRGFVSSAMLEAKEIGARIGIAIDQQPEDRHAVTLKLGAFKTSMLQDVEAGRAIELDALVSSVKELGALTGVATPFTNAAGAGAFAWAGAGDLLASYLGRHIWPGRSNLVGGQQNIGFGSGNAFDQPYSPQHPVKCLQRVCPQLGHQVPAAIGAVQAGDCRVAAQYA